MSERDDVSAGAAEALGVGMALPSPPAGSKYPGVAAAATGIKLNRFCQHLADAVPDVVHRINPKTFKSYQLLLDAVSAGNVDLAWLPPLLAARAASREQIVPIAVPIRGEHAWYAAGLFSASDSNVRGVEDLRGVRAAWVDPKSMAGYVVPRAWLRARGVDFRTAFSMEVFLGAHEDVVRAVLEGDFDVGATFVHPHSDDENHIESAGWGDANVNVLGVAGRIPSDVLAARVGVDDRVVRAVRDALTGDMDGALRGAALALFEADRFAAAKDDAMQVLAELVEHVEGTTWS